MSIIDKDMRLWLCKRCSNKLMSLRMNRLLIYIFVCCISSAKAFSQSDTIQTEYNQYLNDLYVNGKYAISKMEGNTLIFNAKVIRERFVPSTAYELLSKVPVINEANGTLSLCGTNNSELLLIIDGKKTSMSQEQVYEQLNLLTANKIKKIEIFYNAPAKYHYSGPLINVVTYLGSTGETSLFFNTEMSYARKLSTNDNVSLSWANSFLTSFITLGYKYRDAFSISETKLFKNQSFSEPYRDRCSDRKSYTNNFKVSGDFNFKLPNGNSITVDYIGSSSNVKRSISGTIIQNTQYNTSFFSKEKNDDDLHVIGVEAESKNGWDFGLNYRSFKSPFIQKYSSICYDEFYDEENKIHQESLQNINNVAAKIDKYFDLDSGASLSFGFEYNYNNIRTEITNSYQNKNNMQKENILSFYAQGDFVLFGKVSTSLGLKTEYMLSEGIDKITNCHSKLWNEIAYFPTITLGIPIKDNFAQLQLHSKKEYPSFWAISSEETQIDDTSIEVGNPELKTSRIYDASLMFIAKQKWYFILGCTYTPDYFAKIPHQEALQNNTIYRYENYDYSLFNSFTIMHPINYKDYNSRISLHLLKMQDKMTNFYETSFNNSKWVWAISMNNSYKVSCGKHYGNLLFNVDFRYQSPSIQGIYKITDSFSLNANLKWAVSNSINLMAGINNILRREMPKELKIGIENQESILYAYNTRSAFVKITVNLGMKRERKEELLIDTTRYGRK